MDKRGCEQEMQQAASLINQPILFLLIQIPTSLVRTVTSLEAWSKELKQGESIDVT